MTFISYFSQNIHVCTVYTNLGDDAVVHALKETEVSFVDPELVSKSKKVIINTYIKFSGQYCCYFT